MVSVGGALISGMLGSLAAYRKAVFPEGEPQIDWKVSISMLISGGGSGGGGTFVSWTSVQLLLRSSFKSPRYYIPKKGIAVLDHEP